jgi:DNA-binding SARP family transcriptional activator/tetratricopeptide (TPR) repeat protein
MGVEFRVLGDVVVRIDGRPADVGHARQQCVLLGLLADVNRPVSPDTLLDRVWGERAPRRGRAALHSYVSRLRGVLGPAGGVCITRGPGGYVLAADPRTVDLCRFGALVESARAACDDRRAGALLTDALALWRGEAFGPLDTPWVNAWRESVHRQRATAELDRYDIALRLGDHARVVGELLTAVRTEQWDERLAGQLMLALYRCGRQAEALDHFDGVRRRLAERLGADPGLPLRRLHRQILCADPAIAAPEATVAGLSVGEQAGPVPAGPGAAALNVAGQEPPELSGAGTPAAVSEAAVPTGRAAPAHLPVPRQLPASPALFTGRADELAALTGHLCAATAPGPVVISAIGGTGGIGKTWLALRWAHENAARFPDGQLYLDLRGFDPSGDPVPWPVALRGLLASLGVDPARIPADPQAAAGLYRSLVAGRRMLIVLDNARDTETVAPLLPGDRAGAVLITSRHRLPGLVTAHGARPLPLDVLPDADARDLLARHLGAVRAAAEPEIVDELVRHCAGLPLALGIIGARAALEPDRPLAVLAARLRSAATRLDTLDAGELRADLRAVLSCSLDALTVPAAEAFALVGMAPGPDIGLPAAAALLGRSPEPTRVILHRLVQAELLHEHVPGRYRMHDLVRLYAAELAGDPLPYRPGRAGAALHRLLDHYLRTAHAAALVLSPQREPLTLPPAAPGHQAGAPADLEAAMSWFTAEHPVLLPVIRAAAEAGFDRHACALPWTLATFCDRQGHWSDWVGAQTAAVGAARRLADVPAQAQAHRLLANALSNLRRYDESLTHLRTAAAHFAQLGDDAGRAHVQLDIALLHDRRGDPAAALPAALTCLELYRTAGTGLQQAVALNAVGWYHSQLGRHREAIGFCEQALALSRAAGSRYGEANTTDSLGVAHHHLGEYADAADCYRRALALFRAMGDRHAEGLVLAHLGDTHEAAGDVTAAHEAWRGAEEILDDLGHPEAEAVRAKRRGAGQVTQMEYAIDS